MEISETPPQDPLEIARQDVFTQRSAWATHLKTIKHRGIPGTTCHECMKHKNNINFAEDYYNQLRRENEAQKSPPSLEG